MAMAETRLELEERSPELDAFVRAFGEFGGVERRYAHISGLQTRDNGDPDSLFSATGRAIVFNSYSLDLGGFKEEIDPEAVREAMYAEDADYHLLWDHDTTLVLARNRNGTLKAEITGEGVDFWGRVAKTTYAADLRVLMDRGDVDECSFAFTIADGGEEWRVEDDGSIVRRVTKIEKLWDLTICARGAYPATHSATVRSFVEGAAKERAGHNLDVAESVTEERALKPGLVAWDDEQGYNDVTCDLMRALEATEEERYTYWWVIDLNVRDGGTEAIVCRSTLESYQYYLLQGITYDSAGDPVVPEDGLTPVEDKWVAVQVAQPEAADMGDDEIEEYGLKALETRMKAELATRRTREERAVAAAFERAGDSEPEPVIEAPESESEPVAEEPEEPAEEPAEEDSSTEEPEAEVEAAEELEETDERALAAARARARGRAALA